MRKYSLSFIKISCFLIIFSVSSIQLYAQKNIFSAAEKLFEQGAYYPSAMLYQKYLVKETSSSLETFKPYFIHQKEITAKNKSNGKIAEATWKLAECHRLFNDFVNAEKWYKNCFDKYYANYPLSLYWYGVCLRANKNYSQAEEYLKKFVSIYHINDANREMALKELQNLEFISTQLQHNYNNSYEIKKVNIPAGYEAGGFGLNFINDERIAFTSTQTDSTALKQRTNPYKNRLFNATIRHDRLSEVKQMDIEHTDAMMEQGAVTFFPGGDKMLFTQWERKGGKIFSSIYFSSKENFKWRAPVKVEEINVDGFNSMQPFITSDGKSVYFSSDRPGGFGKYDIWLSSIETDNSITTPVNLGNYINGPGDEKAAFYSEPDHTLIFSTNGRVGFGGFDFFRSGGAITTWETPVNMGLPFNSSKDDIYFFGKESNNGSYEMYLSSDRESACCLELYKVEKLSKYKTLQVILTDCKTGLPIADGKIYVSNSRQGSMIDSLLTNINGRFISNLPETDSIDFIASKSGYGIKKAGLNINNAPPINRFLNDTMATALICLEKLPEENDLPEEKNIIVYFDFNKTVLDSGAVNKLNSIVSKLSRNPTWVIEIGGYTDEKGTDKYNLNLGYRRAKAGADYLIASGISAGRIRIKSYGECCPANVAQPDSKTDQLNQSNRRLQFIFFTGSD